MASLKVCTINYALTSGIQLSVTVSEGISSVHQMGSYTSPHEINKNVTLFLWQIMRVRAQTLDPDMHCHVKAEARLLPSQFEHIGICEASTLLSTLPQKDSKSQCQISPYWCTIYRIGWHWGHSQIHSNMPKSSKQNSLQTLVLGAIHLHRLCGFCIQINSMPIILNIIVEWLYIFYNSFYLSCSGYPAEFATFTQMQYKSQHIHLYW